jgi:hypothetical protein
MLMMIEITRSLRHRDSIFILVILLAIFLPTYLEIRVMLSLYIIVIVNVILDTSEMISTSKPRIVDSQQLNYGRDEIPK